MHFRPEITWLDEIRIVLRGLLWVVGLAVIAVVALSLAAELGDVCYSKCSVD
jgi:hypothetical protein